MSINDWKNYIDDESVSLSYSKITFLSTRENTHKHVYSEQVIREYAPSYLGQAIVARYNSTTQDTEGHSDDGTIVGYIPSNQEIEYWNDDEGQFNATFDAVIFKLYAKNVYETLKRDGVKAVSLEQLTGFTDETENLKDGVDYKYVVGFTGLGVAILGKEYAPSLPSANIEMTQMSQIEVEQEYEKHISSKNIQETILEKLENIEKSLTKEVIMKKIEEIKAEEIEVVEEKAMDETTCEIEEAKAEEVDIDDDKDDDKDDLDDDKDDDDSTEMTALKSEIETLNAKLKEKDKTISMQEAQISQLECFRTQVEENSKQEIISTTMAKVKDIVKDVDFEISKLEAYVENAKSYTLDNIGAWKNETIAEVALFAMDNKKAEEKQDNDILDMGMPAVAKTYNSIYK